LKALKDHYSQARVFALASREEGLALVQAQALACGLPLVCTARTGGADLRHTPNLAARIDVTPHGDAAALAAALQRALAKAPTLPALTQADRDTLTWRAYSERYHAALPQNKQSKTL
jgi:alpha-maltose-1-phosphate synthase